jgi:hypothetical protein
LARQPIAALLPGQASFTGIERIELAFHNIKRITSANLFLGCPIFRSGGVNTMERKLMTQRTFSPSRVRLINEGPQHEKN